jgi:hypothetical protein
MAVHANPREVTRDDKAGVTSDNATTVRDLLGNMTNEGTGLT